MLSTSVARSWYEGNPSQDSLYNAFDSGSGAIEKPIVALTFRSVRDYPHRQGGVLHDWPDSFTLEWVQRMNFPESFL
jgi:hypothetical protein